MIKNIPKTIAILLAIAVIIFLSINIYNSKDTKNGNDKNDVSKENKEVIEKLDLSFIDQLDFLESIKQIDDDNYLLFVRQGSVTSSLLYNYTIYKYNIQNGVHLININIDKGYEFCSIDKENKLVYLILVDYENPNEKREDTEIWVIDYQNMIIKDKKKNINQVYNLIVAENGEKFVYNKEDGMYISNIDFSNEIKVLSNLIEEDMMESKSFVPYEFTNNKVVYGKNGYEWVEGIGIYDVKNKTNNFVEQIDSEYLRYSENNIFYTEQYQPKTIQKVNTVNLSKEQYFTLDEGQSEYPNRRVYLSNDLEKILVIENIYNDDMVEISLKLYDSNSKKLIASQNLEPERYANIDDVIFEEDKIIFSKSYNMYVWNYMVK